MIPFVISILSAIAVGLSVEPFAFYWVGRSRKSLKETLEEFRSISYDLPTLDSWLKAWGATILGILLLGILTNRFILGVSLAFILYVLPKQILLQMLRKRKALLGEQLVSAIGVVSNSIQAGISFENSFSEVGGIVAAPLGKEFSRMAYENKHGVEFDRVLKQSKERYRFHEYQIFITAVTTNKKSGGDVADLIEEIKVSLLENQRLERKLAADTASGRLTVNALAVAPLGFLLMSSLLNPPGTALLFNTLSGQCVILIVTLITYTGFRLGQKVVSIEF